MKSKLFAFVIILFWAVFTSQILSEVEVSAQVNTDWVRRYNGPGNGTDWARAIAVDGSGSVYVTGGSIRSGANSDYATIKYYSITGETAWIKTYNGPADSDDYAYAMALDHSGNVCVTGQSYGGTTLDDYATIKYFPNGDTVWARRYNGPGNSNDEAYDIAADGSDNIYVTGGSVGSGTGLDYTTIKYYANGDTAWVRRYNGRGDSSDVATAIAVDASGNVYVTGYSSGAGTYYDYVTIKYYPNGDTVWVRRYNGPGDSADYAYDIVVNDLGDVYVTGYSYGGSATSADYATIKYNPDGNELWVKRYNGPGDGWDEARAIALDYSGNVYVTGASVGAEQDEDWATIKYYPNGETAWVRRYMGPSNYSDQAYAMAVDELNNVYVTGYSGVGSSYDYTTVKYDLYGNMAWLITYDGPGHGSDYAQAIALDGSNNVYVTGGSWDSGTDYDYATIKYTPDFAMAVNYWTEINPTSVFCADLDGDGDRDLAVANLSEDNVCILRNNGDGTFAGTVYCYGAGDDPRSVFCADLDNDGDPDLAVAASGSCSLSVLMNNGNTTFQPAVDYLAGSNPWSIFCADLDGDDNLDLAVANAGSNNVSILKNNGNGTFQLRVNYPVGLIPVSIFCADLDGDFDLDLAVANDSSNNVSILINNGDGTFKPAVNYVVGDKPHSVFCADLDGDSDLDLAVANIVGYDVSILKNNGNATFQSPVHYGAGIEPHSVFCADLDGDADMDLAVANSGSDDVSVLKNNGHGAFGTAVNYGVGDYPISIFGADLDGDGDFDLATANFFGHNVSILINLTQIPANQPPYPFSLLYPFGNDIYQDTTIQVVHFDWQNAMDPNLGDRLRYNLFLSTKPDFDPPYTQVYPGLLISHFTDVFPIGQYYWKVEAFDNWGASRWSNQACRFFNNSYLTDTLVCVAFSPVDFIITDPKGDSLGLGFNTIPGANYDTMSDYNHDGDKDDIATLPNRLVGDYTIRVSPEPQAKGTYSLGIRIDGGAMQWLSKFSRCPDPEEADTYHYYAPWYLSGDANSNWTVELGDVVYLITYLYKSGPAPNPLLAGDANCSGVVELGDVVYLITYLYKGGPPPPC